jgi:hypothetical protein
VEKYRKLQEMARITGQESLTFIDGTFNFMDLKCTDCPADELCHDEKRSMRESCYSNFLNWFFDKEA